MNRIDIGEVELAVDDRGAGPVLLLVHGFPLDHGMWQEQIEGLCHEFRVVAPDLRGFGESGVTPGTVTMDRFADDLAALLEALGIDHPVALCGLSMGGYVAFAFWRRHRARVGHLILCDTRAAADSPQVREGRLAMAQQVLESGTSPVVGAMLPRLLAEATAQRRPAVVDRLTEMIRRLDRAGIAAAQRGMAAREDATAMLYEIDRPTLVVCGQHDAVSPPAEMRGMAAAIPAARFVEIPQAGHMSPMENPAAVNAAIRDFLASP
jgi:pimeloyl-ACP methyl ester carboxylesterase